MSLPLAGNVNNSNSTSNNNTNLKTHTPKPPKSAAKTKPMRTIRTVGEKASPEAKKIAVCILEVLAGERTTVDAAAALGCSLPRYYALEARALDGLVSACEPRRRGPARSVERELAKLKREHAKLEREAVRSQSLLRAATRAAGLGLAPPRKQEKPAPGKKRKTKRPVARALVAKKVLASPPASVTPQEGVSPPAT